MNEEVIKMAIDAITNEIGNNDTNANLLKERGRLRMMIGDKAGAMDDLRKAMLADPNIISDLQNGSFEGNIKSYH